MTLTFILGIFIGIYWVLYLYYFILGNDFHISDSSDLVKNSYSNLGDTYKHSGNGDKSFLAGSHYFNTTEIEVYRIL